MKKLRNLLAMVMAMVMVLSLAACGGAPEAPETTVAAETTVPETEAPIPSEPEETEAPEMNDDVFTDSVTQKGAPAIKGKLVIWDMVDEEIDLDPKNLTEEEKDIVVCEVPAEKLHMIPFADRTETEKDLEDAYNEILKAATLADLDDDMTEAAQESGMDLQKLVVRDLVEINLDEEYDAVLNEEENYIALTFDLGLAKDEKLIVMTRTVDDEDGEIDWEVISGDEIRYNEDGTVTVAFEELCSVAFVVEGN